MKINKALIYILLVLPAILFQSCLMNEEDKFDDSAANRLQKRLEETQEVLVSSKYGWAFDYYPDREQSYGGFNYTVRFTEDSAYVGKLGADEEEASLYKMTTNNGPELSFDTYNTLMHKYATPSSSRYEAYDGDFEFIIDSVGDDKVKIHGIRSKNVMYLYKLTEPAEKYLEKVEKEQAEFAFSGLEGKNGEESVSVSLDAYDRQASYLYCPDSTEDASAFIFSDKGIRFYKPITVNGESDYDFEYHADNATFTGVNNPSLVLKGILSPEYVVNALNGSVGFGNGASSRTVEIANLDQFTFSTEDSWLKVTADKNTLTISVEANNTGDCRMGTILVKSAGSEATLTVVQADPDENFVGIYDYGYYDSEDSPTFGYGRLTKVSDKKYKFSFTMAVGSLKVPMEIPLTYNPDNATFYWQSGQIVSPETVLGYYVFAGFLNTEFSNWTQFSTDYYATFAMQNDEDNGTYSVIGGKFGNEEIGGVLIGALNGPEVSSTNYAGYIEFLQGLKILKESGASSKQKLQKLVRSRKYRPLAKNNFKKNIKL